MKYLVTGGAGFIGSHLVEELVNAGHDVVVLDNLSSGRQANLAGVEDRIRFIEGDIRDQDTCLEAVRGCDGIFHEAALVSVADSVESPGLNHDINITGTLNMLQAARRSGVRRVVFASSAAVYGDNPLLPKTEDLLPEPQSPYAVAKITGEYYLRIHAQLYGMEAVALRYFNVYGPRQNAASPYSGVISIFADRVKRNADVRIFGDGMQTRDFVHVKDVVAANLLAMREVDCTKGQGFRLFNVATQRQHSLLEMLKLLEEICGSTVPRTFHERRPGDIVHSIGCNARLQAEGWMPKVDFMSGLSDLLNSV